MIQLGEVRMYKRRGCRIIGERYYPTDSHGRIDPARPMYQVRFLIGGEYAQAEESDLEPIKEPER